MYLTTAGILQGDTLALLLFVIVVDCVLRQSIDTINTRGLTIEPPSAMKQNISQTFTMLMTWLDSAQVLLTSLEEATGGQVGLMPNAKKKECMILNEDSDHQPILSKVGSIIKEVDDLKYLGSYGQ